MQSQPTRVWSMVSDEVVQFVDEAVVLATSAYMLFYERHVEA